MNSIFLPSNHKSFYFRRAARTLFGYRINENGKVSGYNSTSGSIFCSSHNFTSVFALTLNWVFYLIPNHKATTDLTPYSPIRSQCLLWYERAATDTAGAAPFYIRLVDQGMWNYGKLSFQNIIITAWTTETAWCHV